MINQKCNDNPVRAHADLYPAVAPVCYYDVSIDVHRNSCWGIKLAVSFSVGPKLQQEFPFCVEHLHFGFQRGNRRCTCFKLLKYRFEKRKQKT